MNTTQKLWPAALFVILALYGAVYLTVEAQPAVGVSTDIVQTVGVWVILSLIIAAGFLLRSLNLKTLLRLCVGLGVIGTVLAGFMTYAHFHSSSAFCPAASQGPVACDIVNQSYYSEIMGVPVAILGLGYYLLIVLLAGISCYQYAHIKKKRLNDPLQRHWILFLAIAGVGFTLWLNYIQFFVLFTLCALCEMSATTVVLLLIASLTALRKEK